MGEFTVAVWDGRSRELHVLRDHLGLRGCYVHDGPEWYVAASEPAQVLPFPDVSGEIDEVAICDQLTGWPVNRERSFYEGIRHPLPATLTTVGPDGVSRRQYWMPQVNREPCNVRLADVVAGVRERLDAAVRSALRANGPVMSDLSGGLDSSAVFGVARLLRDDDASVPAVVATSMRYPGMDCDEGSFIEAMRNLWPGPYVEFDDAAMGPSRIQLRQSVKYPIGEARSGLANLLEFALEHHTAVRLSGDGGDELFWSSNLPLRPKLSADPAWRYYWWASGRSARMLASRLRREVLRDLVPQRALAGYLRAKGFRPAEAFVMTGLGSRLADVARAEVSNSPLATSVAAQRLWSVSMLLWCGIDDALTLRFGHEIRRPLLDFRLVSHVLDVPVLMHFWRGAWRSLQRGAVSDIYATNVRTREGKAEFTRPTAEYSLAGRPGFSPLTERGLVREEVANSRIEAVADALASGRDVPFPWEVAAVVQFDRWMAET
jgi:asparagine synthase (glutamine-hydrolysing)